MTRLFYRIYLVPDRFGRMRQTARRTRDFYDIDLNQCKIIAQIHWYRIVQSSPGRVYTALWEASNPGASKSASITGLGAFMRVFSDLWYVDIRDVDLEQASDLDRSALTRPRILALTLALLTLAYLATTNHFSNWNSASLHGGQLLARLMGLAMLCLLVVEQVLNGIKKRKLSQKSR